MTTRLLCILTSLAVAPACGSRRLAGYLAELEADADPSTSMDAPDTGSSTASPDTDTSDTGASTTPDPPETTGTGSGSADGSTTAAQPPDTTTDTTETTGEPAAACGNGVLEPLGPVPEECDDGNLDPLDGCDATCALDRRAFVSSVEYQAAELESLYIADALCFNLADDQGFPDPLKYRAWLSDSTSDARDRFKRGRGRLVLVNGLVLAASWSALLAGELQNPLEVTEKSETYQGPVWTGTRPDGTAVPGAEHCDDWSTNWIFTTGHYGYSQLTTPGWTLAENDDNPISCNALNALYCIQSL